MRIPLAGLLLLITLRGQAPAQDRHYSQGPVIDISYVRVNPGMFDKYMQWLATDWKRNLEAQKKEGIILDYAVYQSRQQNEHDWNIALAVTYPNMAAFDNLRDRTEPIATRTLNLTREQLAQASIERGAMREQIGGRLLRQLRLR